MQPGIVAEGMTEAHSKSSSSMAVETEVMLVSWLKKIPEVLRA